MTITRERLRERLMYYPLTGSWIWLPYSAPGWSHSLEGTEAGKITSKGYVQICVDNELYVGHVLAWFWMTGKWPDNQVDHEDTIKTNNRWSNLRLATNGQNRANSKSSASSGLKGAYPNHKPGKPVRWASVIRVNKKQIYLGTFDTKEQAHAAYAKAAIKYHGEFARMA